MSTTISVGITDLSFHHVAGSLVTNVLRDMEFAVNSVYSPHEANFDKLTAEDVDLLCLAWLPSSHGLHKENVEEVMPLIELGLHYQPYALWGAPDYVPESMVAEAADLIKPEVVEK